MHPNVRQTGEVGQGGKIGVCACRCRERSPGRPGIQIGDANGGRGGLSRGLPRELFSSRTTLLVMWGGAFYNPSNTALEAVVSFLGRLGAQPPKRTVAHTASECVTLISILEFPRSTK